MHQRVPVAANIELLSRRFQQEIGIECLLIPDIFSQRLNFLSLRLQIANHQREKEALSLIFLESSVMKPAEADA